MKLMILALVMISVKSQACGIDLTTTDGEKLKVESKQIKAVYEHNTIWNDSCTSVSFGMGVSHLVSDSTEDVTRKMKECKE